MKNNITTVIFDYGCVLSNPQDDKVFRQIYSIVTDQDFSVFEEVYYSKRTDYDQGLISGKEYWQQILDHFNTPYNADKAEKLITLDTKGWTSFNREMIEFVDEINKKYRVAVLSNMPPEILEYLYEETSLFNIFDKTVFSCDLKLVKPDPEIYKKALEIIGCSGEEAVFIDDRDDNINAAVREGIKGIKYSSFAEFRLEIDNYISL